MALCVLTAHWKTNGLSVVRDCDGFIDGLLAIIVDHSLRAESKEEAAIVSHRISRMSTFNVFADMLFLFSQMTVIYIQ